MNDDKGKNFVHILSIDLNSRGKITKKLFLVDGGSVHFFTWRKMDKGIMLLDKRERCF